MQDTTLESTAESKFEVELDGEACKECGYCIDVCKKEVFVKGDDFNVKGYRPVKVVSPENCVGCMLCFYNCPDFCIEIKELKNS
jgi:NAD-dependent dihydropyrimidine dehydrogenase PreA subunit